MAFIPGVCKMVLERNYDCGSFIRRDLLHAFAVLPGDDVCMACLLYTSFYTDKPSVADNNLITAGSTGALLWAKQIIEHLDVFRSDTLEAWYKYFSTGDPNAFFALMQTLPSGLSLIHIYPSKS